MARIAFSILALLFGSFAPPASEQVRHFPSIVYGQILLGPGASRYETIFTVTARKSAAATLDLFAENGQPLNASFVDMQGVVASTDSTFRFYVPANQPVHIKIQLAPTELQEEVALKTGWANFRSTEELDAWALVRIRKPDGTLVDRHVLLSEKPPNS
jgi:hypothetical protein